MDRFSSQFRRSKGEDPPLWAVPDLGVEDRQPLPRVRGTVNRVASLSNQPAWKRNRIRPMTPSSAAINNMVPGLGILPGGGSTTSTLDSRISKAQPHRITGGRVRRSGIPGIDHDYIQAIVRGKEQP